MEPFAQWRIFQESIERPEEDDPVESALQAGFRSFQNLLAMPVNRLLMCLSPTYRPMVNRTGTSMYVERHRPRPVALLVTERPALRRDTGELRCT